MRRGGLKYERRRGIGCELRWSAIYWRGGESETLDKERAIAVGKIRFADFVLLFHDWCEFRGTGFTLLTDINSFRRFTIRLKIAKPVPFDRWKLSNPVAETLKRRIFIREREFQIGSIEYELFRTKFCWWRGKNLTLIVYLSKFVIIIICASDARCGFKHLDKQSLGK